MSPYVILGVADGAPIEEVKSAYRKLVKKYHPDVNPDDANAATRFREIQTAYEQITSPPVETKPRFGFTSVLKALIEVSVEEAFHGAKKPMSMRSPYGEQIDLLIDIPPNTISGTHLKVNGLPESLRTIDLYIIVVIAENGRFRVMDTSVFTRLSIDFITAIIGGEVVVDTLDGPRYFHVPPGSQAGAMIKLSGLGFRIPNTPEGTRDDFVVMLDVILPTSVSEEQKAALEHYRTLS